MNARDRRWAVYYGWPSLVNGANGDLDRAVAAFAPFRVVVLGDGLQWPSHGDHGRTRQIVAALVATDATRVYGYLDLGVTTSGHPLATLREAIDAWARLGARGIMLDDSGLDFGVTRERLNAALDAVHERGLRALINAWDPADVFNDRTRLRPGDGYLAESFQIDAGRFRSPAEWAAKSDRIADGCRGRGVEVYALAVGDDLGGDPDFPAKLGYAWWSTLLYGFEYFQYTHPGYSAGGVGANVLLTHPQDRTPIGTRYLGPVVHGHGGTRHTRRTDAGTIAVGLAGGAPAAGFSAAEGGR